jgi:myosin-crossreactive antigen
MAVYSLLGLEREAPPVYKGQFKLRVLLEAFVALHEIGADHGVQSLTAHV